MGSRRASTGRGPGPHRAAAVVAVVPIADMIHDYHVPGEKWTFGDWVVWFWWEPVLAFGLFWVWSADLMDERPRRDGPGVE